MTKAQLSEMRQTAMALVAIVLLAIAAQSMALAEKSNTDDPSDEFVLLPKDATCSGAVMYIPGHECIEYWKGVGSSVSWTISHLPAGRYALLIEYSGNPGESGGIFEIIIGDTKKEESIKPTGGWGNFETKRLRVMEVSPDNESLTLVAKEIPINGALMNLRKVILKRKES